MMPGIVHAVRGPATKSLNLIRGSGIILILQKLRSRTTYRKLNMLGHKSTEDCKVLQCYGNSEYKFIYPKISLGWLNHEQIRQQLVLSRVVAGPSSVLRHGSLGQVLCFNGKDVSDTAAGVGLISFFCFWQIPLIRRCKQWCWWKEFVSHLTCWMPLEGFITMQMEIAHSPIKIHLSDCTHL